MVDDWHVMNEKLQFQPFFDEPGVKYLIPVHNGDLLYCLTTNEKLIIHTASKKLLLCTPRKNKNEVNQWAFLALTGELWMSSFFSDELSVVSIHWKSAMNKKQRVVDS